ncbi:hypothetical protein pb186bvf_019100 [Paramecium bursaria]
MCPNTFTILGKVYIYNLVDISQVSLETKHQASIIPDKSLFGQTVNNLNQKPQSYSQRNFQLLYQQLVSIIKCISLPTQTKNSGVKQ